MTTPLFDSVSTWLPFWYSDNNYSWNIDLNTFLISHPSSTYLVKIKWDSMKDAWINNWDIAIVDKSINVFNNHIIIASIWWEVTIKTYKKDGDIISLIPANKEYKTIKIHSECEILWVVIWIIRKYI